VTIAPASGIISTPIPPNTTTTGVDLELKLTALTNFDIYKNVIFKATVSNKGQQTASGIKVTLKIPKDLVYTDAKTANGKFDWYYKTWDVGQLVGGASANLDLTLFPLASTSQKVFAQITSEIQKDVDSTPNNNTTDIPLEDDEADVTITSVTPRSEVSRIGIKAYPSPTYDILTLEVVAKTNENADILVYNINGEMVMRRAVVLQSGENTQLLDVSSLSEGVYMITVYNASGVLQWTKFEK
jgi:hypothetical protein